MLLKALEALAATLLKQNRTDITNQKNKRITTIQAQRGFSGPVKLPKHHI